MPCDLYVFIHSSIYIYSYIYPYIKKANPINLLPLLLIIIIIIKESI